MDDKSTVVTGYLISFTFLVFTVFFALLVVWWQGVILLALVLPFGAMSVVAFLQALRLDLAVRRQEKHGKDD